MRSAILGIGYAVPDKIRKNDDPIFDWLHKHSPPGTNLFLGYDERRVLDTHQTIMDIMLPAAQNALAHAGVQPSEIDVLLGIASVSTYLDPNQLAQLHQKLGLPNHTLILPLNNEFINFNASLILAHSMIQSGTAKKVLVIAGGNWTRYVDYHTPQAISAADGAGAVVMGASDDPSKFAFLDFAHLDDTSYYGSMYMVGDPGTPSPRHKTIKYTAPYFHITPQGIQGFSDFGVKETPKTTTQLLAKHQLQGADVALVSHQASSVLIDAWQTAIQPAQYIQTLEKFANMTVANIPVSFAWGYGSITTDYVVMLGIGVEMAANTVMLKRG
ncbi:MAG: 3-oxoacyl-ACP synthase [Anaerolineae bacterium]|nr:3-oxoacyl-ACP synthase [Anaerolineae bacterium]